MACPTPNQVNPAHTFPSHSLKDTLHRSPKSQCKGWMNPGLPSKYITVQEVASFQTCQAIPSAFLTSPSPLNPSINAYCSHKMPELFNGFKGCIQAMAVQGRTLVPLQVQWHWSSTSSDNGVSSWVGSLSFIQKLPPICGTDLGSVTGNKGKQMSELQAFSRARRVKGAQESNTFGNFGVYIGKVLYM
jgi:hypothetical protein